MYKLRPASVAVAVASAAAVVGTASRIVPAPVSVSAPALAAGSAPGGGPEVVRGRIFELFNRALLTPSESCYSYNVPTCTPPPPPPFPGLTETVPAYMLVFASNLYNSTNLSITHETKYKSSVGNTQGKASTLIITEQCPISLQALSGVTCSVLLSCPCLPSLCSVCHHCALSAIILLCCHLHLLDELCDSDFLKLASPVKGSGHSL